MAPVLFHSFLLQEEHITSTIYQNKSFYIYVFFLKKQDISLKVRCHSLSLDSAHYRVDELLSAETPNVTSDFTGSFWFVSPTLSQAQTRSQPSHPFTDRRGLSRTEPCRTGAVWCCFGPGWRSWSSSSSSRCPGGSRRWTTPCRWSPWSRPARVYSHTR